MLIDGPRLGAPNFVLRVPTIVDACKLAGKTSNLALGWKLLRQGLSTPELRRASLEWSSGNEGYVDYGKALLTVVLYTCVAANDLQSRPLLFNEHND